MIRLLKLPCGLAATLLATVCLNTGHAVAGPSVNVAMRAAFPAPPYIVELLEAAAGENATSYFPLLDRIADGAFTNAKTDKELYEKFLQVLKEDGHMQTPKALSTFKLALSMRSAAPRIEAHYQYYDTAVTPSLGAARADCAEWILLGGKQYCSASLTHAEGQITGDSQLRSLPFDRTLGTGSEAILYADITKPEFSSFHKSLVDMARKGEVTYRLRYRVDQAEEREPLPVGGYGIELQLKRTDYIVIDDREAEAQTDSADKPAPTDVVLDGEEEVTDLKPLSSSELASLGLKAGSFIMQSDDPFQTLIKLTQDFPKFSASIAAHNASDAFVKEHRHNRALGVPAGMNVFWMNGVQLIERQIDPFSLVDSIRRERKLIEGVTDLGLTGKEAVSLLGNREVTIAKSDDEPRRFDWRDEIEEGRVIVWLNNIEKDKRYADYPKSLMSLMQRTYPGQVPQIRKDIFNLIAPVDFSKPEDLSLVVEQLQSFIKRLLPVRFGLVPLTPTKEAEERAKVVYHLLENYGLASLMSYLEACSKGGHSGQASFDKAIKNRSPKAEATPLPFKEVLESEHYAKQVELSRHWVERLNANPEVPLLFLNGLAIPRQDKWLQMMSMRMSSDLQIVQQGIFMGSVDDETWIPGLLLEGAPTRRNSYIFPEGDNTLTVLNVNKLYSEHKDLFDQIPAIEASEDTSKETWATLTVVADLSSQEGLHLLLSALSFRRNNPGVRLDIINNPLPSSNAHQTNVLLKKDVTKLLEVENLETLELLLSGAIDVRDDGYNAALSRFLTAAAIIPGSQLLILNGRVVGPFAASSAFKESDFDLLLEFEQGARILPVYRAVDALGLTEKISGPLAAAKLTSVTALSTMSDLPEGIFESAPTLRTTMYDQWNSTHTMIDVGDPSTANIHFVSMINPASEVGQKWAAILKVLSQLDGVYMQIFLNPKEKLEELPIKRFYRYILDSAPSFDDSGKVSPLGATFKGLPSEALLNLGMDVPPAWLVAAKYSVHDLDNLKLSSIKADVDATYELEHILIEGHSRESTSSPPRGVQLLLGTELDPHFDDTIIMSNLGYFQFKANPGYYNIHLKEGRSSEIFDIISVGAKGYNAVPGDEGTEVALIDFQGTTLYPRLQRKPGMELEDVLEEGTDTGGDILSRGLKFAEGILGGSKSKLKSVSDEVHAEINIFSVASGHLYERMLNIMMVSVMKNTNHTVKFWFIEQFLSPSFKDFIPHLAKEYGFKYEMVTYKWPHWLRQQKEKQREIWGYKILFLDVLFPLSLDKVIFVDADQIVRTDMMDLVNLDLEGAPYGFTPMCDSRTEMEGFRFWKQGYWKNYLRGNPYHISALYVVDLRRFRQLAAGDRLRQHYHQLSADPASLSNLDQDLPNHMQFVIPIHSLSQEWLWCETWCSDESQKEARTIDLCNNPQTKEPKLDRARRQVPEWTVYDDEIAAVDRRRRGLITDDDTQKVLAGSSEEKNTKSRTLEESEPRTKKDEL
ncbi:UDP-glucose:glycoprotein glucosyltransferase [Annulohypoxylon maeteangense]|uniref:UDP-glucose:glycoprotein glucosyltransferase n=1 Tax=Annulohypoxylon maeteangense TaxID=1927788 RepID=UPI0020072D66|nr:UDP-glucose:glycoprotein glucosyltransferase [Annulohypoxylon maeteangense]KAI0880437.1 UDP-glucose:glycoprotein glucosyltransferase [Annulohypoxylon maeteangense]